MSVKKRYYFENIGSYLADTIHDYCVNNFDKPVVKGGKLLTYKVIEDTYNETYDENKRTYYITIEYTDSNDITVVEKRMSEDADVNDVLHNIKKL